MWEKDRDLLKQYRECVAAFMEEAHTSIESGEVPDYESACVVEAAKL